ncbi:MAG: ABC transporter ATP-binding protein [Bacteroidota bacterium]
MARFWRLLKYAKKYRGLLILSILCNVLTALFTVVSAPAIIPFLQILFGAEPLLTEVPEWTWTLDGIKNSVNFQLSQLIQENGRETALIYVCVGITLVFLLKNLFRYLSAFFLSPVRNGMVRDIRQQLFEKVLSLDLGWFSEKRKGDLMARITTDVQEIEWSIFNVLVTVFREPLVIIGSLIFLLYVSPQLTLFVFGLMLFTGVIIGGIGRTLKKKSSKVQTQLGELVAILEENLSGLKIVKSFAAESEQAAQFQQKNNAYNHLLTRLFWRRDLSSPLSEFLGITMVAILLWYGSALVFAGTLTAETFLAFLFAFFNVSQPTKAFSNAFYNIQKGLAAVDRVEEILAAQSNISTAVSTQSIANFEQSIEFRNVDFRYGSQNSKVIERFNLTISKGQVIAIVGGSGSGKTTLIDLLLRFYDITQGEILVDGVNIKKLQLNNLRSLFGVVSQEPILFNDSIERNITFGKNGLSKYDSVRAAKIANAHDFIEAIEGGYEANIGDGGSKLSGGQRQRLTIARAILRNPPILILDEATSALDTESELLVQSALEKMMKDRTTIIIAHRLSTIRHADKIVVLKDGKIVETGTHQSLLAQRGEYQKFVAFQEIVK